MWERTRQKISSIQSSTFKGDSNPGILHFSELRSYTPLFSKRTFEAKGLVVVVFLSDVTTSWLALKIDSPYLQIQFNTSLPFTDLPASACLSSVFSGISLQSFWNVSQMPPSFLLGPVVQIPAKRQIRE